ncbi:PQQ-binding-like beta-propeller repeat protein [Chloroflexi bacterium TSY]|nr:PQQ-binding-like beta-propeller repeat protein [Chloroflexi bacterium TSY]
MIIKAFVERIDKRIHQSYIGKCILSAFLPLALLLLLIQPLYAQQDGLLWDLSIEQRVDAAAMSADGSRTAFGARDNVLRVLDADGSLVWDFAAENSILGVDMTDDGAWIAVASEDRFVYLLDQNGIPRWQFKAKRPMNNAAVANDGTLIAATSDDLSVYTLDEAGNLLWQEEIGIGVRAVAVYGSGEKARVVVGADDGSVSIYSRAGKRLLQSFLDYDVRSLAVTANGARILVGTSDGRATLLHGGNGDQLWHFDVDESINSVAMTSKGKSILIGSEDGSAYLLDDEGQLVQTFTQDHEILSVALSSDGSFVTLGTVEGTGAVYDVAAAKLGSAATASRQRWILGGSLASLFFLAIVGTWAVRNTAVGYQFWETRTAGPRDLMQQVWKARYSYLLILPTILLLLTFNYYPALSGLYHAFTRWSPGIKTEWVGLENFRLLLDDRFFLAGFRNAAILIVVAIVKTMTMPLLVAELIFKQRNRFTQYWERTLFVIPIVLPLVVEILLWNNIYDPEIGLLNQSLDALGLDQWTRVWYGDASVALSAIIFIGFPWVQPFALLIFYGGLISISDEIIDSSKVDGATVWRRFWSIDLPLLMGQIKLLLILNFINAVQTFELVFLTTGGGPGAATYTPALELYYKATRMDRFGVASAIGMILFVIILAGTIINMRFVKSSTEFEA